MHKDDLEDIDDNAEGSNQNDSWAQTLQKLSEKQDSGQVREASGRGVRRKTAKRVRSILLVRTTSIDCSRSNTSRMLVPRKPSLEQSPGRKGR